MGLQSERIFTTIEYLERRRKRNEVRLVPMFPPRRQCRHSCAKTRADKRRDEALRVVARSIVLFLDRDK